MRRPAPALLTLASLGAATGLAPGVALAETMPQLNFANPLTTAQVVWMALIFAGLYFALSRVGLPAVEGVLAERAQRIEQDLATARQAKAQADAAAAEARTESAKARAEANAAINSATVSAKAEADARNSALAATLDAQLAEAEQRIEASRASAMSALRDVATETATALIARMTGQSPDAQAVDGAVHDALAARGQA
jgi:F-type H+-transporting ATPase subunit b